MDDEDLVLLSVAEAIAAAKADGCSDASISAATAALAAKEGRLTEGASAATYVYHFACSYSAEAARKTSDLAAYMTDASVLGREATALKTLRERGGDIQTAIEIMRASRRAAIGSLAMRIETEHGMTTVGGPAGPAAGAVDGSIGWDKAIKNANAKFGATDDATQTKH